jgi:hypothetical protein
LVSLNNRIVKGLSPRLNDKEVRALLALMKERWLTDSKLKEILGFKVKNLLRITERDWRRRG